MDISIPKIFVFVIVFVIILWIWLIWFFSWRKTVKSKIDFQTLQKIKKDFKLIKTHTSAKEQIIDYDKLLHKILLEMWYVWNFGDILKQNPRELKDIETVWKLHKIRNKLVHDFDLVANNVLRKRALDYEKVINEMLNAMQDIKCPISVDNVAYRGILYTYGDMFVSILGLRPLYDHHLLSILGNSNHTSKVGLPRDFLNKLISIHTFSNRKVILI